MAHRRWLVPRDGKSEKPVFYHVLGRVVDRGLRFGAPEKEHFRKLVRRYEKFSGCRALTWVAMGNHYHILLEVPPMPEAGLSPEEVFRRLGALYSAARVNEIRALWETVGSNGNVAGAGAFLAKFTARMHDLSHFMRGILQRFTRWFNRRHNRSGTLWERRFTSVIVEAGVASRTVAAYIDLNPVRAGIVKDPADYRWSGYGEAVGGGAKARAGLVRALHGHEGRKGTARGWAQGGVAKEYRFILVEGAEERVDDSRKKLEAKIVRKGMSKKEVEAEKTALESRKRDLAIGKAVRCHIRYFAAGAVLGSRGFVDGIFASCRERFSEKRVTGARKPRGALAALSGELWSARDLQKGHAKSS